MEIFEKGEAKFCRFDELMKHDDIVHVFSLKPLNFRNRDLMEEDYKKLFNALDLDYKYLVKPNQAHTDNILLLDKKVNIDTADIKLDYLENVDGIITNQKNVALATTSADCLCVILYDPKNKVIANVHSGWRGTFKKIVKKAAFLMKNKYDCNLNDILVFLMPAIRQCHFEVDEDVMAECKAIFTYTNRIDEIIKLGRKFDNIQKYNIDNVLINKLLLEEEGIPSANIFDSGICSVCSCDVVHSRRADGDSFGLGTTIVMMK